VICLLLGLFSGDARIARRQSETQINCKTNNVIEELLTELLAGIPCSRSSLAFCFKQDLLLLFAFHGADDYRFALWCGAVHSTPERDLMLSFTYQTTLMARTRAVDYGLVFQRDYVVSGLGWCSCFLAQCVPTGRRNVRVPSMLLAVCLLHAFLLSAFGRGTSFWYSVWCCAIGSTPDWRICGMQSSFLRGIKSETIKWRVPFDAEVLHLVAPVAGRSRARFSPIFRN